MYNLNKDKMKEIPKKMEELNNKVSDGVANKMKTNKVLVGGAIVIVALLAMVGALSLVLDNPVRGVLGIVVLGGLVLSPELMRRKKLKSDNKVKTVKKTKKADVVTEVVDVEKDSSKE